MQLLKLEFLLRLKLLDKKLYNNTTKMKDKFITKILVLLLGFIGFNSIYADNIFSSKNNVYDSNKDYQKSNTAYASNKNIYDQNTDDPVNGVPTGGGGGTGGPGIPMPIDMYEILLIFAAIILIFNVKNKLLLINTGRTEHDKILKYSLLPSGK